MNNEGMVASQLDKANKLLEIGMKAIKLQMSLIGTTFIVQRPKSNSKWKNVFGGTYSSNSTLENDYEEFSTRLIVNLNEMKDVWNRNRDTIDSVTDDGSLEVGDELQYTRDSRTYRFKVVLKQSYSESSTGIFQYTLMSIIETLDE